MDVHIEMLCVFSLDHRVVHGVLYMIMRKKREISNMDLKEEAMNKTKEWLEKEYGQRCTVMAYGCPVCEMWMNFDRLFADIDAEYSWNKKVNTVKDDEIHLRGNKST